MALPLVHFDFVSKGFTIMHRRLVAWTVLVGLSAGSAYAEKPVVVLIGDSIRMGYSPFVIEGLKDQAEIVSPAANGGDSSNVLKNLDSWAVTKNPTVVHINAGLHDLKFDPKAKTHQVEIDSYKKNLRKILDRLTSKTRARIIFALTTPVLDARHNTTKPFHRLESDVQAYNKAALEVLAAFPDVRIHDLHAVVEKLGRESALVADGVHYTKDASKALGAAATTEIKKALDEPAATRFATCKWTDRKPVIDGKLDDPAWAEATVIDKFPSFWMNRPSDGTTKAKLLWADDGIYFAAEMKDKELFTFGEKRQDMIFNGDVFELFFKPEAERPEYYEFEVNAKSIVLELSFPRRGGDFKQVLTAPPLGVETVAYADGTINKTGDVDRGWGVEGRLPWSIFEPSGGRPKPGAVWFFALCRYDYGPNGSKPILMSSAPLTKPSFHAYEDYGRLTFEGKK